MRPIDFTSHLDYWVALAPEVILSLTAVVILMIDAFARGKEGRQSGAWVDQLTLAGIVVALLANAWLTTVDFVANGMVAHDGFRLTANFIVLVAAAMTSVIARPWLEREHLRFGEFHVLMLLATVGMMILMGARDLILLFLGLELMSIAVYVLTGYARRDARSAEAGLKYFIVGAFASAFLLYGIALTYGAVGTTRVGDVAAAVAAAVGRGDLLLVAGIGMLLIGFGFKVAAVPFHMWTPDAYEGAPTPVTAFMASGVKAAAFVAMLRLFTVDLAGAADVWREGLWWLAMLTMIVPNLIALAQRDVKRMLAYSSVAHAGYLLVAVAASSSAGRGAALFYLAAYTVTTIGAFALVYHIAGRGDVHTQVEDYRGLGWKHPWLGAALVVFLLSLAGFPPTAGFVGKLALLQAAVGANQVSLAVVLVLSSLVAYYYYLRIVWKMYFESPEADAEVDVAGATPAFRLVAGASAIAVLLAGLIPGLLLDRTNAAGAQLDGTAQRPSPAAVSTMTAVELPGSEPDVP